MHLPDFPAIAAALSLLILAAGGRRAGWLVAVTPRRETQL